MKMEQQQSRASESINTIVLEKKSGYWSTSYQPLRKENYNNRLALKDIDKKEV